MRITSSSFVKSSSKSKDCPDQKFNEYAFIGRSNVGKSSLINSLTNSKKLAKISGTPGKTLLINHFLINKKWFLVDLPGYGFARKSKKEKRIIEEIGIHPEHFVSSSKSNLGREEILNSISLQINSRKV